jgi:hypothetical protein
VVPTGNAVGPLNWTVDVCPVRENVRRHVRENDRISHVTLTLESGWGRKAGRLLMAVSLKFSFYSKGPTNRCIKCPRRHFREED